MAPKSMKSRRRKNIFKDFQKVKLKAGKTLPKGLNVTDASFKSRQIQIREQFQKDESSSEQKSHRQLNIATLLSQLEHYNANIRRDALYGLQQVLQSSNTSDNEDTTSSDTLPIWQQHMGVLISRAAALMVDRDTTVRQAALKLIQIITSIISSRQISPFFKLIVAHVCCAMTHIEEQIQIDSMKFVDTIVQRYPRLIAENSMELLPRFIGLIARRAQGHMKPTLAVSPGLKLHAGKWRTNVLDRLYGVLYVVHDHLTKHVVELTNQGADDVIVGNSSVYEGVIDLEMTSNFSFCSDETNHRGNVLAHPKKLEEFVNRLLPLLIQSWVECTGALVQNVDVDDTMAAVVKVTALLCRCIHSNQVVSTKVWKTMANHLVSGFPYSFNRQLKKKAGKLAKVSMFALNLGVCEIICNLSSRDLAWNESSSRDEKVAVYLLSLQEHVLEQSDFETVLRILESVLAIENHPAEDAALTTVCGFYEHRQLMYVEQLHELMIKYVIPKRRLSSILCVDAWLRCLPELFISSGQGTGNKASFLPSLLRLMTTIAPLCYVPFSRSLEKNINGIIDVVLNTTLAPCDQRRFVALFYSLTDLSETTFVKLLSFCRCDSTNVDVVSNLLEVIYLRMSDELYCDTVDYLRLVYSLCVVQESESGNHRTWSEHCELMKIVSEKLSLFPNSRQILKSLLHFIDNSAETMTIPTMISLFTVLSFLIQENQNSSEFIGEDFNLSQNGYVELLCSLLMEIFFSNESALMENSVLETVLNVPDVYRHCLQIFKDHLERDPVLTLDKLYEIVRLKGLNHHLIERSNVECVKEILKLSKDFSSADNHEPIRRKILYEVSLLKQGL